MNDKRKDENYDARKMALGFLIAFQQGDRDSIWNYIFIQEIEFTQSLKSYFSQAPNEATKTIESWFEQRDLNKKLNENLKYNNSSVKKSKL